MSEKEPSASISQTIYSQGIDPRGLCVCLCVCVCTGGCVGEQHLRSLQPSRGRGAVFILSLLTLVTVWMLSTSNRSSRALQGLMASGISASLKLSTPQAWVAAPPITQLRLLPIKQGLLEED